MVTASFVCGFECGQLGSVGRHWTAPTHASFNTTTVRSGIRSLELQPNGSATDQPVCSFTPGNTLVGRCYINFASLPDGDATLFTVGISTANLGIGFQFSTGKIKPVIRTSAPSTTFGATGVQIRTGQWYRLDMKTVMNGVDTRIDVQVDGVALTQQVIASTSAFLTVSLGSRITVSADMFFDDVILSSTAADYPIGAGFVNHFVPVADGIHNTGTAGNFIIGAAGANITDSTTNAYTLIDEVPLDGLTPTTNDYINQAANGATNYTEHVFGPAPGIVVPQVAPRAVEAIIVYHQQSTGVGNSTFKLADNGTEDTILAFNAAGVTTNKYQTKQYATPPSGGTWNLNQMGDGAFNNLRCRFGYSSDTNPNQYFDGIMLEAEFAPLNPTIWLITA